MTPMDQITGAMVDWLATTGAAGAVELAACAGVSERSARARVRSLERAGLVRTYALLAGAPALHVLTRRGLRHAGRGELEEVAISAAGFAHQLAVARVAAALHEAGEMVGGERELRAFERLERRPIASAAVGLASDGTTAWHRPDLVCWRTGAPIAIEVELTVKSPARLRTIVRGWARSRCVAAVVYYAAPAPQRALAAALRSEGAAARVLVLALERAGELVLPAQRVPTQAARSVTGAAVQ